MVINQNLHYNNDTTKRRNCHYLVLFNNPVDRQHVMTLARRMSKIWRKPLSKPYGYLLLDLKQNTREYRACASEVGGQFHSFEEWKEELLYVEGMFSCDGCGLIFFLFVWDLSSHSRIFQSYGDVTITGEVLHILTFARHWWPLSSEDSLGATPTVTWGIRL